MLSLVHLASFVKIAELGSVSAAARALSYSQPAVSSHLRPLEQSLGVSLVQRTAGKLTITAEGRRLQAVATRLLRLADDARAIGAGSAPEAKARAVVERCSCSEASSARALSDSTS